MEPRGGNRRQSDPPWQARELLQSVANACHRLHNRSHGKEWSTVRVGQRALENASKWRFLLPRCETPDPWGAVNLSPEPIPKAVGGP